jgi:hypothetical protein
MTPMAIEMTLAVRSELDRRIAESEQHHRLRITHAQYECDVARRRFMFVDPANRLVAAGLEAEWNAHLSALAAAEDELGRFRAETQDQLTADMRRRIMALCGDIRRAVARATGAHRAKRAPHSRHTIGPHDHSWHQRAERRRPLHRRRGCTGRRHAGAALRRGHAPELFDRRRGGRDGKLARRSGRGLF